jgi:hypothetical protein
MQSSIFSKPVIIVPPKAINKLIYRCEKRFITDLLLPLFELEDKHLAVHVDKKCTFYIFDSVEWSEIKILHRIKEKKHKKGGQSSVRFERINQHVREDNIGMIIDLVKETSSKYDVKTVHMVATKDMLNEISAKISVAKHPYCPKEDMWKLRKLCSVKKESGLVELESILQSEPDLLVFGDQIDMYYDTIEKIYNHPDVIKKYGRVGKLFGTHLVPLYDQNIEI